MAGKPVVVLNTHKAAADLFGTYHPPWKAVLCVEELYLRPAPGAVKRTSLFRMPDRRSNIYSNRPRLVMASEILTGGIFMVFCQYNDVCVYA